MAADNPLDNYEPKIDLKEFVEKIATGRQPARSNKNLLSQRLELKKDASIDQIDLAVERMLINPVTGQQVNVDHIGSLSASQSAISSHLTTYRNLAKLIKPALEKESSIFDKASEELIEGDEKDESSKQEKSLEDLFRNQNRLNKLYEHRRRIDMFIDREIKAHQFSSVISSLDRVNHFMNTTLTTYLKKSIELKYKHIFIAKDTLSTMRAMSSILESKLENIKHNTSLPDLQKTKATETLRRTIYNKMMSGVFKTIPSLDSKFYKDMLRNLKGNVYQPGKDGLYEYAYSDDSKDSAMVKQLKATLRQTLPLTDRVDDMYSTNKSEAIFGMKSFRNKISQKHPRLGKFIENIVPEFHNRSRVQNQLIQGGLQPLTFDKATRTSIVEIIPGWLGKIHKSIKDLATGRDNEEEVYDIFNRKFTTVSNFKTTAARYMNRNMFSQVSEQGFAGVGTLSAAYDLNRKPNQPKVNFDNIKKDLMIFFTNHALSASSLRVNVIRKFSEGSALSTDEDSYIKIVFAKIDKPMELANIVTASVFKDGSPDQDVIKQLNLSIQKHTNDNFQEKFTNLFEGHGYRRHFSDIINEEGFVSDDYVMSNKLFNLQNNKTALNNLQRERDLFIERRRRSNINKNRKKGEAYDPSTYDTLHGTSFTEFDENLTEKVTGSYRGDSEYVSLQQRGLKTKNRSNRLFLNPDQILNVKDKAAIEQRQIMIDSFNKLHESFGSRTNATDYSESSSLDTTSILSSIEKNLAAMRAEQSNMDYAKLDTMFRIHAAVQQSPNMSNEEKQRFGSFVQLISRGGSSVGGAITGTASRFKNLTQLAWRKAASAGIMATGVKTAIGASMLGPLGAWLGFDSGSGFKRTKAVGKAAGYAAKHVASLGFGLAGLSIAGGLGLAKLGLKTTGFGAKMGYKSAKFGLGLFKRKKKTDVKPNETHYFDIYTEESLSLGKPAITAKQQENQTVIFHDVTPIKNSFNINKPVTDLQGNILISEDDIKKGLYDSEGTKISKWDAIKNKASGVLDIFKSKGGGSRFSGSKIVGATLGGLLGGPAGAIAGLLLGGKLGNLGGLGKFVNSKTVGGALGGLLGGVPGMLLGVGSGALMSKGLSAAKNKLFGKKSKAQGDLGTVELVKHQFKDIIKRLDKIVKNTRNVEADDDAEEFRSGSFLNRMKSKLRGSDKAKLQKGEGKVFGKGLLSGGLDALGGLAGKGKAGILGLLGLGGAGDVAENVLMAKGALGGINPTVAGGPAKAGLFRRMGGGLLRAGGSALSLGGRGVGLAGRGLLAGAAAVPGLVSSAAAATGTALTGLAGTAAGVLAAIPVAGWIALGIGAVALGGYGLYKYLKHSDGSKKLLQERIKAYGMTNVPDADDVRKLENRVHEYITKEEGPLTEKEIKRYIKRFKLPETEQSLSMLGDFISSNFIPRFGAYLKVVESFGKEYKDMKKIDEKDPIYEPLKQKMISAMNSIKVSGPSFSEIVNPNKEKEDTEKESSASIPDSDKGKSKIAAVAAQVEKKPEYRDPNSVKDKKQTGKKLPAAEAFKPKDDLYNLIKNNSDSQLKVLRSIHHEIKLLRLITEKHFSDDDFDLLGSLQNSMGAMGDYVSSSASRVLDYGKSLLGIGKKSKFRNDVRKAAFMAARKHNVPEEYLLAAAMKESSGGYDPTMDKNGTFVGPWQVSETVRTESKVRGDRYNVYANAEMAAAYYNINKKRLSAEAFRKAGVPINNETLYLAHQQGAGGVLRLYTGEVTGESELHKNTNGGGGLTHRQFIEKQRREFGQAAVVARDQLQSEREAEAAAIRKAKEAKDAQLKSMTFGERLAVDPSAALIDVSK